MRRGRFEQTSYAVSILTRPLHAANTFPLAVGESVLRKGTV